MISNAGADISRWDLTPNERLHVNDFEVVTERCSSAVVTELLYSIGCGWGTGPFVLDLVHRLSDALSFRQMQPINLTPIEYLIGFRLDDPVPYELIA